MVRADSGCANSSAGTAVAASNERLRISRSPFLFGTNFCHPGLDGKNVVVVDRQLLGVRPRRPDDDCRGKRSLPRANICCIILDGGIGRQSAEPSWFREYIQVHGNNLLLSTITGLTLRTGD